MKNYEDFDLDLKSMKENNFEARVASSPVCSAIVSGVVSSVLTECSPQCTNNCSKM
ncbi:hypothetical protein [Peptostreptococcus porci]|uniref:hypothetical protein n=1 Tax=Peptostreptococcus porci TaxID=2652282 RepID=UPI002A75D68F|nr:hypothetical protein [Peptostreptococcus porci]MDY2793640.1 hypothetical protein [Peptostreptococcus porci]